MVGHRIRKRTDMAEVRDKVRHEHLGTVSKAGRGMVVL